MAPKRLAGLLTAAVGLIAALVFVPAIAGGWIYDDEILIADNPYAHALHWWPRYWVTDFWNVSDELVRFGGRIAYWRPLVSTSYAVDWQIGGGSPVAFHITNLLLQVGVGALTFITLRRWMSSLWPAFIAALLFVVHPTKAESVAWISGRTDVICMLAVLLVSLGIARRLRGAPGGLALEVFGTLIAYTSKEQAIILPAFAAVEAWVAAGRGAIDLAMVKRMIRVALPQIVVAVLYLGIRSVTLPVKPINVPLGISASHHVQAVFESLGRFIALTFVPHDLSIQQGLIHVANGQPVHSVPYMILGGIGTLAVIALAWFMRKRAPMVTLGIAFFLVTIAPTSNLVYTQMETLVSERFLYLPFLGVALVLGAVLTLPRARQWWLYAALVPILIFAIQSFDRSRDYADEDAFWARELALHPTSPVAQKSLIGKALREKRYKTALVKTLDLMRTDVDYQDLPVAFQVSQLLTSLTPDHNTKRLHGIDTFLDDVTVPKTPSVTLSTDAVTLTLPTTTGVFRRYLGFYKLRIVAHRALLQSKLGNDAKAVELISGALTECPRCLHVVSQGVYVFAAAGDYETAAKIIDQARGHIPDEAITTLDATLHKAQTAHDTAASSPEGPAKLQARASELSALELWGRAYDVLAPYKEQIRNAPKFVKGFAELAFRAGETDVARDMLQSSMSPAQIDDQLAAWSKTMGWAE